MRYEDENIWLTQKMLAILYDVDVRTINEHIKKIYSDSELDEDSTIRNFRIVQTEGSRQVTRDTKYYNLQIIIAVGFKVNSERAVLQVLLTKMLSLHLFLLFFYFMLLVLVATGKVSDRTIRH